MSLEALIWGLSGPNKLATVIKSYLKKHQTTFFLPDFFSYCYISGKVNMKFPV